MLILVIFASVFIGQLNAVVYDAYSGKPATKRQLELYKERNNKLNCAINIEEPCDPEEWRRLDGSCNNLKHPSRGTPRTPCNRVLKPEFSVDYEPRNMVSGEPFPSARQIRTTCLLEGKANDLKLTQLLSYYILFSLGDVISIHDVTNYVENITNCCTPEGKKNYACTPVEIPVDDPVHRYSGVSCQNLTRPQTFQYFGCAEFGTTFARIVYGSPVLDLSGIYTHVPETINHIRRFKRGLLNYDSKTYEETGKIFPVGNHTKFFNRLHCFLNEYPKETLCFQYQQNTVLGSSLVLILFYRLHNYIARQLHKLNPCWDDDRLFYTARDINIAIFSNIYFYQLLPIVLGRKNMLKEGLISCSDEFRDLYDEVEIPQVSDEFVYVNRWMHTIQEATLELYDENGAFYKTMPIVNLTQRHGFLVAEENMEMILSGSHRQASGKFDHAIDFDMAERILGGISLMSDVATSDLARGRFYGFPPYIKYREFCSKKEYKSFDDLKDVMTEERIHNLKGVYKDVRNVELMAGCWAEEHVPGGKVPHTVYCLMVEQFKRTLAFDRHWFERPNRPHAFTIEQLRAVKKVTVAGLLCATSNYIKKIQPKAFYSIHKKLNPLVECDSPRIGNLDITPWKDPKCDES